MRIAIIGTGIAGNVAAWKLRNDHDICVYEAASYVGGHTNTIDVVEDGRSFAVDTGFIVFNERTYPHFIRLLDDIGQASKPSDMSFSVRSEDDRIEYNSASLNGVFAQRKNLLRPSHYRMLRDILRFFRDAVADVQRYGRQLTVGEYLRSRSYGSEFVDDYLVPMAAAIWSAEPVSVLDMPALFLVRFFENHGLLQLQDRPHWRVIEGGSREYVRRLTAGHRDRIRLDSPVTAIRRVEWRSRAHPASRSTTTCSSPATVTRPWRCLSTPHRPRRQRSGRFVTSRMKQCCIPTCHCCRGVDVRGLRGTTWSRLTSASMCRCPTT